MSKFLNKRREYKLYKFYKFYSIRIKLYRRKFKREMFRLMFGGRSGTCKPVKHSPGSKREQYSDITLRTLGSGDLIGKEASCEKMIGADLIDYLCLL